VVVAVNYYDKNNVPSPLGFDFTLVPSAGRINVTCRDVQGFQGGNFEVLCEFIALRQKSLKFHGNTVGGYLVKHRNVS